MGASLLAYCYCCTLCILHKFIIEKKTGSLTSGANKRLRTSVRHDYYILLPNSTGLHKFVGGAWGTRLTSWVRFKWKDTWRQSAATLWKWSCHVQTRRVYVYSISVDLCWFLLFGVWCILRKSQLAASPARPAKLSLGVIIRSQYPFRTLHLVSSLWPPWYQRLLKSRHSFIYLFWRQRLVSSQKIKLFSCGQNGSARVCGLIFLLGCYLVLSTI